MLLTILPQRSNSPLTKVPTAWGLPVPSAIALGERHVGHADFNAAQGIDQR